MSRVVIWFILSLLFVSADSKHFHLTIEVSGFPNNKGVAFIALFQDEQSFPVFGKQFKGVKVEIKDKRATTNFKGIERGNYAIAVFHDANKNGVMDKNLLGVPTEFYGFSNNARAIFSAPSFSSAAFDLKKDHLIKIIVK
jgi:uncharacterized protein (DUF2141 family)